MSKIKLVATDIDGTLISSNMQLSEKNREALDYCVKNGIKIVAATGRTFETIPEYLREYEGIEYLVCANGSGVYAGFPRKLLHTFCLSPEAIQYVDEIIKHPTIVTELSCEGAQYTTEENIEKLSKFDISDNVLNYIKATRTVVDSVVDLARDKIDKIEQVSFCFSKEEEKQYLYEKLCKSDLYVLTSAWSFNYEIIDHKAGKGNGVSYICELNNISSDEVLAIGNNDNDVDMLDFAGVAVAVEDSTTAALEAADFIAKPCKEDGFAEAIHKFVK